MSRLDDVLKIINNARDFVDEVEAEEEAELRLEEFRKKRREATAAALELCPDYIKEWLILCTSSDNPEEAYSNKDLYGDEDIEWFEVGHNATHYFSFGVRGDGIFISRASGPEYNEECQCWYDLTTVKIVSADDASNAYWGHQ